MPKPEMVLFLEYIDGLIAATRSGAMDWIRINPTTFIWDTATPTPARLSLQLVESRGGKVMRGGQVIRTTVRHFMFQAFDLTMMQTAPERQRLAVNGADEPEANEKLQMLYDAISAGISQKGLEFLKSILPPTTSEAHE
jgi:hypothetical protein